VTIDIYEFVNNVLKGSYKNNVLTGHAIFQSIQLFKQLITPVPLESHWPKYKIIEL